MQLVFSTPSGTTILQSVFLQFESVPAGTCAAYLGSLAPDVHADTAVTRWRREDCDYGMAIDALLRQDGSLQREVNAVRDLPQKLERRL